MFERFAIDVLLAAQTVKGAQRILRTKEYRLPLKGPIRDCRGFGSILRQRELHGFKLAGTEVPPTPLFRMIVAGQFGATLWTAEPGSAGMPNIHTNLLGLLVKLHFGSGPGDESDTPEQL